MRVKSLPVMLSADLPPVADASPDNEKVARITAAGGIIVARTALTSRVVITIIMNIMTIMVMVMVTPMSGGRARRPGLELCAEAWSEKAETDPQQRDSHHRPVQSLPKH